MAKLPSHKASFFLDLQGLHHILLFGPRVAQHLRPVTDKKGWCRELHWGEGYWQVQVVGRREQEGALGGG